MPNKPSLMMPALIGGSVFGFIAGVPLIGAINCACCALIIGGGLLAAYLHSQNCKNAGQPFTTGDGALVGLAAAIPYAVVSSIAGGLFSMLFGGGDPEQMLEMLEGLGMDIPPEAMDQIATIATGGGAAIVIGFFISLFFGLVFSTVGGLIGGAAFKSEPPPPPPSTSSYGGSSPLGSGAGNDPGSPLGGGAGDGS